MVCSCSGCLLQKNVVLWWWLPLDEAVSCLGIVEYPKIFKGFDALCGRLVFLATTVLLCSLSVSKLSVSLLVSDPGRSTSSTCGSVREGSIGCF